MSMGLGRLRLKLFFSAVEEEKVQDWQLGTYWRNGLRTDMRVLLQLLLLALISEIIGMDRRFVVIWSLQSVHYVTALKGRL